MSRYAERVQAFELPPIPLREDAHGIIRVVGSRVTLDPIVAVFDRGGTPDYLERRGVAGATSREDAELRSPTAGLREKLVARRGKTP